MATVAELLTKFTANTTGLKKGLAEAKTGTNAFGKGIVSADSKTMGLNKTLGQSAAAMLKSTAGMLGMAVAIGMVVRVLKQAITIFSEYEQSMANVRSVTKATHEEFAVLQQAAKNAGETTRFTANQAADALYYLASAGLTATEATEALEGVLLLAGATSSDLAFTAQTMTAIVAQFSLKTEESTRVSNVFAAAIANSQATMEKLSNAFMQVGPVAAGLGISLEETTGALQVLFNAGFKGQKAGRALKSALADLSNEASVSNRKLAALGISFADIDPTVHGLAGAIKVLHDEEVGVSAALDIFGKVAGPQMAVLIKQGSDAIDEYTDAVTGTNEAAEQYAIQNDTLAGDSEILKSVVQSLAIEFGEGFAPALRSVIRGVTNMLIFVKPLIAMISELGGTGLWLVTGPLELLSKAFGFVGDQITNLMGIIERWDARIYDLAEKNEFFAKALRIVTLGLVDQRKAMDDEAQATEHIASANSHVLQIEANRLAMIEAINQQKLEQQALEEELAKMEADRIQNMIDTRVKGEQSVEQARMSGEVRLRAGFITQQEFNDEMIKANERLVKSLAEVGYDGLRGDVGDGVLNQAIAQIRELTQANADLAAEEENRLKITVDLKQAHIDEMNAAQAKREAIKANIAEEKAQIQEAKDALLAGEIANQQAITAAQQEGIEQRGQNAYDAAMKEREGLQETKNAADELKQTYIDMALQIPGQIAQVFSALRSLSDSRRDSEIADLEAEAAARIANGEDAVKVAEETEAKKAKIEYKYALANWKLQLASSIASGAQMILNGFLTQPFIPAGLIAGALATTLAAIQVGAVSKAKPKKNFATGIESFKIPEGFPNDSYQAGFSTGEILKVETPNQQAGSSNSPQILQFYFDSEPFYEMTNVGIENRKIRIPS